jgi:hypothetical protein
LGTVKKRRGSRRRNHTYDLVMMLAFSEIRYIKLKAVQIPGEIFKMLSGE